MPTSSILASFNTTDKKTAEAFVDALERSASEPKHKISAPAPVHLVKKEQILEFFGKGGNTANE